MISSGVAVPSATSCIGNRLTGSRSASDSRSVIGRYSTSSSDSECEYGRMTCACTSAGPLRARQCATARDTVSYEATGSHPSTSSTNRSGNPLTSFEMDPPAVCTSFGTEIA